MSLLYDIIPYMDDDGFVSPSPVAPGSLYTSGNGVMYTSEFIIMASKLGILEDDVYAKHHFVDTIEQCIDKNGLLNRFPLVHEGGQEGPDDYYGLMNACMELKVTHIPRNVLKAIFMYKGALNNVNPGKWTAQSFLIRQPQLLTCIISAAFPSLINPLHILIRLLCLPLYLVSALIIATNSLFIDQKEVDTRRLGWHVMNTLKHVSLSAKLASFIWLRRLYKDYGPKGMRAVATRYYSENHPFTTYWVD